MENPELLLTSNRNKSDLDPTTTAINTDINNLHNNEVTEEQVYKQEFVDSNFADSMVLIK